MSDKTLSILTAATTMFARYGYAKTTIGDIVAEAGVARQTLYNTFSSKEEILRAVVRHSGEEMSSAVSEAWAALETVDEKLEAYQEIVVCGLYETIQTTPDWQSLMDGLYQAASDEMAAQDVQWRKSLFDLFNSEQPPEATMPTEDIVEFFQSNSMNSKYGAQNIEHMRMRLKLIRTATGALLKL